MSALVIPGASFLGADGDWLVELAKVDQGQVEMTLTRRDGEFTNTSTVGLPRLAVLRLFDREQARQPTPAGVERTWQRHEFGQACATNLIEPTGRGKGGWYRLTPLGAAVVEMGS